MVEDAVLGVVGDVRGHVGLDEDPVGVGLTGSDGNTEGDLMPGDAVPGRVGGDAAGDHVADGGGDDDDAVAEVDAVTQVVLAGAGAVVGHHDVVGQLVVAGGVVGGAGDGALAETDVCDQRLGDLDLGAGGVPRLLLVLGGDQGAVEEPGVEVPGGGVAVTGRGADVGVDGSLDDDLVDVGRACRDCRVVDDVVVATAGALP